MLPHVLTHYLDGVAYRTAMSRLVKHRGVLSSPSSSSGPDLAAGFLNQFRSQIVASSPVSNTMFKKLRRKNEASRLLPVEDFGRAEAQKPGVAEPASTVQYDLWDHFDHSGTEVFISGMRVFYLQMICGTDFGDSESNQRSC